ncbi:MAG: DUF402 domain-containing protein [Planctomycetes bacterium]|nr:DUF402 domain-containing protein [Planctomycetota bacterium]
MKIVDLSRPDWRQDPKNGYTIKSVNNNNFKGNLILIEISKIDSPWWCEWRDFRYCIADLGYTWVTHITEEENYLVHTVFDSSHTLVHHYIDIIDKFWFDKNQKPLISDLYIDLVILPNGEYCILDQEELANAFKLGEISEAQYRLARKTAERLETKIAEEGSGGVFSYKFDCDKII